MRLPQLTFGKVLAGTAVVLVMTTGTAYAHGLVNSADIVNGSIRSVDIGSGEVKSDDIDNATIRSADIKQLRRHAGRFRSERCQPLVHLDSPFARQNLVEERPH